MTARQAVLWYVEPDRLDDAGLGACQALLAPEELERGAQISRVAGRRDHLVSRALLRAALSAAAPVPAAAWRFGRTASGKPEITAPAVSLGFSLTHTGGLVACLVAPVAAGVDAEPRERPLDATALARRYLSAEEFGDLLAFPSIHRRQRLLELWTLKEAYLKARGTGLAGGLDALTVLGRVAGAVEVRMHDDDPRRWQLGFLPVTDRHVVAYALCGTGISVRARCGRTLLSSKRGAPWPLSA